MKDKKITIHANNLEDQAKEQFDKCCSHDFVIEASLMPDAHSGYVAPIGSVIKTKGVIVPSWVGYDIGCGMIAVKISDSLFDRLRILENSQSIFDEVNRKIPMGVGRHNQQNNIPIHLDAIQEKLSNLGYLWELSNKIEYRDTDCHHSLINNVHKLTYPNIGTLGAGNHFIEILFDDKGDETWLVIHSGSRGVGHYVGTYFMKLCSGLDNGYEDTYGITKLSQIKDYMIFQEYCLEFSLLNRMEMAKKVQIVIKEMADVDYDTDKNLWTNKNHNHCIEIEPNIYLHRKGATSSELGERGVIPANMRDGCFLVEGLGNSDFLNSSSHGAGRRLGRGAARKEITLDQFKDSMKGIVAPVSDKTIDESPMAYKDIFEVMELQSASVKVIKHLKPIINWKG